jgi:hypothetical protein
MPQPETRYARNGDAYIAYQTVGEGPLDLVYSGGLITNVDLPMLGFPRGRALLHAPGLVRPPDHFRPPRHRLVRQVRILNFAQCSCAALPIAPNV